MKRLLTAGVAAAAFWAAACGGGGGTMILPPPVGKFSKGSLNGTYAFTTNGEVITNNGAGATPMVRVGSFVADGAGGITGGVEDVNTLGTPSGARVISGGSYNIGADRRGTISLTIGQSSINFGIVLTTTSDGLLIDETSNTNQASTGSGNFIKQDTALCASPVSSVNGTYVFDFTGLDRSQAPKSFVGAFTANGNTGTTSANHGDINDNFNLTLTDGSFTGSFVTDNTLAAGPAACGRGQAVIDGDTYEFYVVDSTRVRFVTTLGGAMLTGDAVLQQNIPANITAINSGFAFVVAGSNGISGLTRVGRLSANGAAVTQVLMDYNEGGTAKQTNTTSSASLTYDPATGRGTLVFQDTTLQIPFTFVFYLSSATQGAIQETTGNTPTAKSIVAVADGTLAAQTAGPFSSSNITGTYALNWSGLSFQQNGQFIDEEDLVGQATVSNSALSGAADIFQFTAVVPLPNLAVGGSIAINGHGTGDDSMRNTMGVKLSGANTINFDVYFVSPQLAFIASHGNQSPTRILAGILKLQP